MGCPHAASSSEVGSVFLLFTPFTVRWDMLSGMGEQSDLTNYLTAFFYR